MCNMIKAKMILIEIPNQKRTIKSYNLIQWDIYRPLGAHSEKNMTKYQSRTTEHLEIVTTNNEKNLTSLVEGLPEINPASDL